MNRARGADAGPLTTAEVDARLRAAGTALDAPATAALTQFVNLVLRWNRVYNLTGKRGAAELVDRHLVESLALEPSLVGKRIADVGSGAGFPGIPLAICARDRQFTLIESRLKRARFLRHAVAELGLANATVAHSRAEDLTALPAFDTVLARAVARPQRLLEIVRPLLAPGGILLLLTSAELARGLREPGEGFVARTGGAATGLRSTLVVLERERAP